jgi:hypothetical protein
VGNVITTQPANKVTVAGGNTVFSAIPVSGTSIPMAKKVQTAVQRIQILSIQVFIQVQQALL